MPDATAERLRSNPQLAAAVCSFNHAPATYLHPCRRERILPGYPAALWQHARGQRRLNPLLLWRLELDSQPVPSFDKTHHRLALLPSPVLRELVFLAGMAADTHRLRAVLERQTVLKLRQQLGTERFHFATTRAPFLVGNLKAPIQPDTPPGRVTAQRLGMHLLALALADVPANLWRRFCLKFPADYEPKPATPSDLSLPWARLLIKILHMEVDPSWKPLFT